MAGTTCFARTTARSTRRNIEPCGTLLFAYWKAKGRASWDVAVRGSYSETGSLGVLMVKSEWLPTMPLHVAIWSQIVMEAELSWADQGKTIRLLANAWSSGELSRKAGHRMTHGGLLSACGPRCWRRGIRTPHEGHEQRPREGSRRGSVEGRTPFQPMPEQCSEMPSMRRASSEQCPSMLQACVEHPPSNAQSMEQEQKQEQEQEQEQDQERKPLTSFERNPLAARAGWLRVVEGSVRVRARTWPDGRGRWRGVRGVSTTASRRRRPRDLAWKAVRKAVQIRGLGSSRRTQPQTAAQRSMETAEEFGREAGVL